MSRTSMSRTRLMHTGILAGFLAAAGLFSGPASGQVNCTEQWSDQFAMPGFNALIEDAVYWDDGTGEALFVCGSFLSIGNLGLEGSRIAKWDGEKFVRVTTSETELSLLRGINQMHKLQVFDPDGPGPQRSLLIATGNAISSPCVLKYDGTAWSRMLGVTGEGLDLEVFNGQLYVCGKNNLGGIARWTGTTWTRVGGSVPGTGGYCTQMAVCDADNDGSDELYVGGTFFTIGNPAVGATKLAKWNGTSWSAVPGFTGTFTWSSPLLVDAIDLGDGPSLIVANAQYAGITEDRAALARLHQNTWSTLIGNVRLSGLYGLVYCATMFQGQLHVGGAIAHDGDYSNGTPLVLRRDTLGNWGSIAMNTKIGELTNQFYHKVRLLKPIDFDASGPGGEKLLMSGDYNIIGGLYCPYNALWNGTSVEMPHVGSDTLGISTLNSLNEPVNVIKELDIDAGGPIPPKLYIAGDIRYTDGVLVDCSVLTFDGNTYTQLPPGLIGVNDLEVFDDGTGAALYAAETYVDEGEYQSVWKLNTSTSTWTRIGNVVADDMVPAVVDGTPALVVTGNFRQLGDFPGGNVINADGIARWDGTSWQAMTAGIPSDFLAYDSAGQNHLAVANGQLYIYLFGTTIDQGTGNVVNEGYRVFRWDAGQWVQLPLTTDGSSLVPTLSVGVRARIASLNFGGSESLYLFGSFTALNGSTIERLARWTGTAWEAVGGGLQYASNGGGVTGLATHDFGQGVELVATFDGGSGETFFGGDVPLVSAARFNGEVWSQIPGFEGSFEVVTIASSASPAHGGLYFGGSGVRASNNGERVASAGIARLITTCTCPADFNNSGNVSVQDIFDFLGAWFAGNASADVNDSGTVTVQDIFDFLGLWFAGC